MSKKLKSAKKIVKQDGDCSGVFCYECPIYGMNIHLSEERKAACKRYIEKHSGYYNLTCFIKKILHK